jgi:uncharacterized protein YfaT (DUF1175 family)
VCLRKSCVSPEQEERKKERKKERRSEKTAFLRSQAKLIGVNMQFIKTSVYKASGF